MENYQSWKPVTLVSFGENLDTILESFELKMVPNEPTDIWFNLEFFEKEFEGLSDMRKCDLLLPVVISMIMKQEQETPMFKKIEDFRRKTFTVYKEATKKKDISKIVISFRKLYFDKIMGIFNCYTVDRSLYMSNLVMAVFMTPFLCNETMEIFSGDLSEITYAVGKTAYCIGTITHDWIYMTKVPKMLQHHFQNFIRKYGVMRGELIFPRMTKKAVDQFLEGNLGYNVKQLREILEISRKA